MPTTKGPKKNQSPNVIHLQCRKQEKNIFNCFHCRGNCFDTVADFSIFQLNFLYWYQNITKGKSINKNITKGKSIYRQYTNDSLMRRK